MEASSFLYPSRSFDVSLSKSCPADVLGLSVSPGGGHLRINEINLGLVQRWNETHAEQMRTGDMIVAVNGRIAANGDARVLRDGLAEHSELRLRVFRVSFTLPSSVGDVFVEPCRYFARGCRYEQSCRFSHLASDETNARFAEIQRLGFREDDRTEPEEEGAKIKPDFEAAEVFTTDIEEMTEIELQSDPEEHLYPKKAYESPSAASAILASINWQP